jgi:hypothetical protein
VCSFQLELCVHLTMSSFLDCVCSNVAFETTVIRAIMHTFDCTSFNSCKYFFANAPVGVSEHLVDFFELWLIFLNCSSSFFMSHSGMCSWLPLGSIPLTMIV